MSNRIDGSDEAKIFAQLAQCEICKLYVSVAKTLIVRRANEFGYRVVPLCWPRAREIHQIVENAGTRYEFE